MVNDKHKISFNFVLQKVGPPKADAVFSKCFDSTLISDLREVFNTLEDMSDAIVADNRFVYKDRKCLFCHVSLGIDKIDSAKWLEDIGSM